MTQPNLDIKDLPIINSLNEEDRVLMTEKSKGHSAAATTVTKLKEAILDGVDLTDYYSKEESEGIYLKKAGDTITGSLVVNEDLRIKGSENSDVYSVKNNNSSITVNSPVNGASIRTGLNFQWYNTNWQIGNIRGGNTNSVGFGITSGNNNLRWRINTDGQTNYGFLNSVGDISAPNIKANNGYLFSTANGHQVEIGSRNTSWCHFNTTAPSYYFNKQIMVDGNLNPYTDNTKNLGSSSLRWANIYGSSATLNRLVIPYNGGNWITMATRGDQIVGKVQNSATAAHSLFMLKNSTGSAIAYGGLGVNIGFYGFKASRISAGNNGTDWSTVWNVDTGLLYHTGNLEVVGYVGGARLYAGWDSGVTGSISCNQWFRSDGNTGWYSNSYGGGIYMTDSTYVRVYNAKAFAVEGVASAQGIGGHNTGIRLYQGNHTGITMANSAFTWGIYSNQDGNMYIGRRTGYGTFSNADKYVVTLRYDTLSMAGNIVATGEITAYSSSDIRLKTNIGKLSGLGLLRKVNTYTFDWTDEALLMKTDKRREDEGFIAQEIEKIAPHFVTNNMWGKGYLGLDKTKFIPYLVAGVNELDDEVTKLKKKVSELETKLLTYENFN